jgi:Ca2+/Na+ antiporter
VLDLVLAAGDLEGAALGTGLAVLGVTLTLAAVVRPFPVDFPTDSLVVFALSPLAVVPFVLVGTLTLVHGVVFASMLLEAGSAVAIERLGTEQTVFGATVLTVNLTLEYVMLTLDPVRRGVPEIGVGSVIGSVLFWVTGNVGLIMLVSDLTTARSVLLFHLPAVLVLPAVAGYVLARGRVTRPHGVALGARSLTYWVLALVVYGSVPVAGWTGFSLTHPVTRTR